MQVLVALAAADGAIVGRDDLTRRCWEGRVVGEDAINRVISRLRRSPWTRSSSASKGRVSDSGEGRWTVKAAVEEAVPAHVLTSALYERFSSRGEADFCDNLLSAMRYEFGGHLEKPAQ